MTRARVVRHAGVAWATAVAGAWLMAASCRTIRDAPVLAADTQPPAPLAAEPMVLQPVVAGAIRVGVLVSTEQASITAAGGVVVRGAAAGENVALVRALERATFRSAGPAGRLRLIETGDELVRAQVQPADAAELLHADATPYRGVFEILPAEEGHLTVVNVVPLEDYLRGVVPNELAPEAFPQIEALKAQAVAARSYVLAHLGDYSSRGYDVCATAACQVYRGSASEHPLTDRAVRETQGLVATWRGRPIHAFYTSTCGGHTEEGTAVFEDGAPYLRGVACPTERPLPGEEAARGGDWEVRLTPLQVARAVARYGDVGDVQDLVPTKMGVSGRVVELSVVGSAGELDLRGMHVSQGLGLRESLFVIHRETGDEGEIERFVITGKGWGHGVGLCQVGASGMAQSGASFEAILKHYYTGIAVQPLANFDTRRSPS